MEFGIVGRTTEGFFRYQAWPTVTRGTDGTIFAGVSGHRLNHICPFGKDLMYVSKDEGETWSCPIIINDTYLDAWNAMPPHKPSILSTFLGKITRRISLDRLRRNNAEKRGGGQAALSLDELMECIPDGKRYSFTFQLDSDRALEIREDFAKRNMLCEQEWNVPGSTTFKTITEFKKQYTIFDVYGCWIDIDGTLVDLKYGQYARA